MWWSQLTKLCTINDRINTMTSKSSTNSTVVSLADLNISHKDINFYSVLGTFFYYCISCVTSLSQPRVDNRSIHFEVCFWISYKIHAHSLYSKISMFSFEGNCQHGSQGNATGLLMSWERDFNSIEEFVGEFEMKYYCYGLLKKITTCRGMFQDKDYV